MDERKSDLDVLEGDVVGAESGADDLVKQTPVEIDSSGMGALTTPLSLRGMPVWLVYLAAAIGFIYLLNPTAGFVEFIPDNFPIVGNLDEGAAMLLIWYGLVEFFEGRKRGLIEPKEEE